MYIESIPQPHVNFIEEDINVYSIFLEEESFVTPPMITMIIFSICILMVHVQVRVKVHGIVLYSPLGKIHNFSYRLEFACTNNVAEFEALILGLENDLNLGCQHLTLFGDFELVVNLIRKIYNPSNKILKRYIHVVWDLVSNILSFNITYVCRELN
jgi:hypothetical protein